MNRRNPSLATVARRLNVKRAAAADPHSVLVALGGLWDYLGAEVDSALGTLNKFREAHGTDFLPGFEFANAAHAVLAGIQDALDSGRPQMEPLTASEFRRVVKETNGKAVL